ncbi:hypothetical protein TELCIR_03134 [Teladorsagia circumcincta]|uniref:Uncharacterized protein n=1 Tax=Teladorsagia circumcincta TaxID=45464 RepID=A0A2G9UX47_TELCI|nr:hypothetical protein TELCIR_03134 [Teladorsagia circumcincta]
MLSAYLGVCQEDMYRVYGKHAKESMFMVHFLSIPGYALLGDEIVEAFYAASRTPPLSIFGCDLFIPTAWGYILGICVLQSSRHSLGRRVILYMKHFILILGTFLSCISVIYCETL